MFGLSWGVVVLGLLNGVMYGLLAVGLVLVYRSSRIVNFAHGDIGGLAAAIFGVVVINGAPYWVMFPVALALGFVVGGASELVVVRRLRSAPPAMSVIATLGLGQVLGLVALLVNNQATAGFAFPKPSWLPTFHVGALLFSPAYVAMVILSPLAIAAITLFLRRSRHGLAILASADNEDAARMAGVVSSRMSTLSWGLAGALSAFTVILVLPTIGFSVGQFLGPTLLLRALAPAVFARMSNLPVAFGAGIGVGLLEAVLRAKASDAGIVELVLFGVVLMVLLLLPPAGARRSERGAWLKVQPWPALSAQMRQLRRVRYAGRGLAVLGVASAASLALTATNATSVTLAEIAAYAIVAMSLAVATGLSGQLSLGQFALAGVGATTAIIANSATGSFLLALIAGGTVTALASLVIGLPALRLRGLMLTVTTLAFALAAQAFLFHQSWALGSNGRSTRPPTVFGVTVGPRGYFVYALAVLGVTLWVAGNIWRSGLSRRLRAVRDNEDCARAFAVSVTRAKMQGFLIAGFIAGLGGAVYGHLFTRVSAANFPVFSSFNVAAMAVLGGLGFVAGPILGALYIIGIPEFASGTNGTLAATAAGWLLLILYVPGGLAELIRPVRMRALSWLARSSQQATDRDVDVVPSVPRQPTRTRELATQQRDPTVPLLEVSGLTRYFGGVHAVDDVSFCVRPHEILGLIGANGAGKTTTFELVAGFQRPQSGTVVFAGRDITRLPAHARAQLGLVRSFQDAGLFATLTVEEALQLALEDRYPTRLWPALVGIDRSARRREMAANDLLGRMGLGRYRDAQISNLSTGTRRITELACMAALEPRLILLDEPTSGIAQRETEALADVLRELKQSLDMTIILIEHDMPFVMGLSDRVVAMEAGRVIAEGTPGEIQQAPAVIASYLGDDQVTLHRSGRVAAESLRCSHVTARGSRCSRRGTHGGLCHQHTLAATSARTETVAEP